MPTYEYLRRFREQGGHKASRSVPVATQEELLDFANKLREGGDADPLEALLPSKPSDPNACLIANACNFSSSVSPEGSINPETKEWDHWSLMFPQNMDRGRAEIVAKAADCTLYEETINGFTHLYMKLPREIGNAAHAFDQRIYATDLNTIV